jgi:hypothetical protein
MITYYENLLIKHRHPTAMYKKTATVREYRLSVNEAAMSDKALRRFSNMENERQRPYQYVR